MCSDNNRTVYNDDNVTHASYRINHYIDTINGHIILTTVCDEHNYNVSVSTLELKD
jgi:DNA-directed RNA polymerase subunit L